MQESEQKEVSQQLAAVDGEHAFRVELNSFNGIALVPQSHDDPIPILVHGVRADLQFARQALLGDDQGVIAGGLHG